MSRALVFAALVALAGCQGRLATRTETIEVPRKQLVPMPAELTAPEPEPPPPAPKCVIDNAPVLCNPQPLNWIDELRAALGRANDKLAGIRKMQAEAIKDSK